MRSREAARTRERLVRAAFQEMYRTGLRSDLNAILAAGCVTKGTLYYHFDSEEAPGYTVVDEVLASISREKWVWLLQNARNPRCLGRGVVQGTSCRREDLECWVDNFMALPKR